MYDSPESDTLVAKSAMVDRTGGFGVDFSYLARGFSQATYVERQRHLCDLAEHNMAALGLDQARIVCGDGVEYLRQMGPVDFIYLDPARRDEHGSRTYAIEDCTPNVLELRDLLLAKSQYTLVTLSPMLEWRQAVAAFAHLRRRFRRDRTRSAYRGHRQRVQGTVAGIGSAGA